MADDINPTPDFSNISDPNERARLVKAYQNRNKKQAMDAYYESRGQNFEAQTALNKQELVRAQSRGTKGSAFGLPGTNSYRDDDGVLHGGSRPAGADMSDADKNAGDRLSGQKGGMGDATIAGMSINPTRDVAVRGSNDAQGAYDNLPSQQKGQYAVQAIKDAKKAAGMNPDGTLVSMTPGEIASNRGIQPLYSPTSSQPTMVAKTQPPVTPSAGAGPLQPNPQPVNPSTPIASQTQMPTQMSQDQAAGPFKPIVPIKQAPAGATSLPSYARTSNNTEDAQALLPKEATNANQVLTALGRPLPPQNTSGGMNDTERAQAALPKDPTTGSQVLASLGRPQAPSALSSISPSQSPDATAASGVPSTTPPAGSGVTASPQKVNQAAVKIQPIFGGNPSPKPEEDEEEDAA